MNLTLLKTNGSPAVTTARPAALATPRCSRSGPSRTSRTWSAATQSPEHHPLSIGNEIDYATTRSQTPCWRENYHPENPSGENLVSCAQTARHRRVRALDSTRPVTPRSPPSPCPMRGPAEVLDAAGYNYQETVTPMITANIRTASSRSENSHQLGAWRAVQTNDFIAGQVPVDRHRLLGEANEWPNRASGAGLLDLCAQKPLAGSVKALERPADGLSVRIQRQWRPPRFAGIENWNWPSNSTATRALFCQLPRGHPVAE